MADKRISEFDLITSFNVNMYIPLVDPNEALAEDRNKRFTLSQLFGSVTSFTGTTQGLSTYPHVYIFTGSSNCVATLPDGAASLIGLPITVINLSDTASLTIQGTQTSPADSIEGSDPYEIPAGDKNSYVFKWTGSTWIK